MPLGISITSWGLCNCPGAALAGTFSWVAHQVCCTWARPRCLWELSLPSLLPSNPGVRLRGSCPPCTGKNRLRDLLANPAAPSTLGKGSSSGRWKGLASPWVLPIPSISLQFCSYPSHNHQVTHLSFKWPCFFLQKLYTVFTAEIFPLRTHSCYFCSACCVSLQRSQGCHHCRAGRVREVWSPSTGLCWASSRWFLCVHAVDTKQNQSSRFPQYLEIAFDSWSSSEVEDGIY